MSSKSLLLDAHVRVRVKLIGRAQPWHFRGSSREMWQHRAHPGRSSPPRAHQAKTASHRVLTRLVVMLVGVVGGFGPSCFTSALDTAGWKQRTIYQASGPLRICVSRFMYGSGVTCELDCHEAPQHTRSIARRAAQFNGHSQVVVVCAHRLHGV